MIFPWRYIYLLIHRDNADLSQEFFGAITYFDPPQRALSIADIKEIAYAYSSKPIFVLNSPDSEQG